MLSDRIMPIKSINPTADYGLFRSRIRASAAAGYLQRYAAHIGVSNDSCC
jgi:hypothetical protein